MMHLLVSGEDGPGTSGRNERGVRVFTTVCGLQREAFHRSGPNGLWKGTYNASLVDCTECLVGYVRGRDGGEGET